MNNIEQNSQVKKFPKQKFIVQHAKRHSAKAVNPWLCPFCYRKYIPNDMQSSYLRVMVDLKGFEPSTSRMRTERAPSCATGPFTQHLRKECFLNL